MSKEIILIKTLEGAFLPATQHDHDEAKAWPPGKAIKVTYISQKERSIRHHKLYFGGLLELAMDYWEPKGGLISSSEIATLKKFSKWLDNKSNTSGAIDNACKSFLTELRSSRAENIQTPEKSKAALHRWVKEQAGYYTLEITPSGIRKEPISINFNAMKQEDFNDFYKSAFGVVWRFILSRSFANEKEAENAILQLSNMG